jgi:bifunctional non-homologous end joining protein LigD
MEASSPDKVMFPGGDSHPEYTKADLVGYYDRVADKMLPMLLGRPLTLHRFPQGIGAKGFMQKNVADHFPASIERHEVPKQEGGTTVYPVVTQSGDIPWLANQGTITFHIWTTTVEADETIGPDWLVLDLDPADSNHAEGADVHRVATATRAVLDEFGLDSHPVATGSKGFHLWVALDRSRRHDDVAVANRALAGLVVARHPDVATTEFLKKDRKGRVFVDWLRANRGATVVAPLSLRAKPAAPVATPLGWDEVAGTAPNRWTIADQDRLLTRPMLTEVVTERHRLPAEDIVSAARDAGVDLDTPFDRFGRKR